MRRSSLALILLLVAGGAWAGDDAALLPPSAVPSGWRLAGRTRVFTGSGLYGHIDGGAEIFFEFGFEEAIVQRYSMGREAIEVELYRMTDPAAALGIYLQRCGNRCETPGTHAAFPRYTTQGHTQVMFVQGRFLVVATADDAGHGGAALPAFASELTKRLPPDRPIESAAFLEPGWLPGSWRLIRGPLALQAMITLGDGDVLQLRGRLTASAAEYAAGDGRPAHTRVIVEYPDGAEASAAVAHLRTGLDAEIHVLHEARDAFVFRDYAGKFGDAVVVGRRLTLRLNLESDPGGRP